VVGERLRDREEDPRRLRVGDVGIGRRAPELGDDGVAGGLV